MTPPLRPTSIDPFHHVDRDAFARDLDQIRKDAVSSLSWADFEHLRKMERWGRACTIAGYATGWIAPNPLSILLLSTGSMARWTIVVHHVSHRGLDRIPEVPERYTSKLFAKGKRRWLDWLDWIAPEAWDHEHNVLHHFRTSEVADPDLVEENVRVLRDGDLPLPLRYAAIAFYAMTWKLTYYAPSTFQVLSRYKARRAAGVPLPDPGLHDARGEQSYFDSFDPRTEEGRAFWRTCIAPYAGVRFVLAPLAFAPLGPLAVASVAVNTFFAELCTNLHTFAVIATNHAGDDLYRFEGPGKGKGELYLRQVVSSVNFTTGGDVNDFLHGFLNYQIEHHLYPDLPPRTYQAIAPRVQAVCEKHGVPYVKAPVLSRVKKLLDVMVGKTSMLRAGPVAAALRSVAA